MSSSKKQKTHYEESSRPRCNHPVHASCCLANETQLLRNFGLTDEVELDTVGAFLCHSVNWGSESLVNGFSNMFKGMHKAIEVYGQMKAEMNSLHTGIMAMKSEMSELKDQHVATETAAIQAAAVNLLLPVYIFNLLTYTPCSVYRTNVESRMPATRWHWPKSEGLKHVCKNETQPSEKSRPKKDHCARCFKKQRFS